MGQGYLKGGWREKYFIAKQVHDDDGNMVGITFTDPEGQYFVLRYDKDPHARKAMQAYLGSIWEENNEFAVDINRRLLDTIDSEGGRLQHGWRNKEDFTPDICRCNIRDGDCTLHTPNGEPLK